MVHPVHDAATEPERVEPILPGTGSRRRSSSFLFRTRSITPAVVLRRTASRESGTTMSRKSINDGTIGPNNSLLVESEAPAVGPGSPSTVDDTALGKEGAFSSSNRSLLGALPRKLSNPSIFRRQSGVASEFKRELVLVKRNILSSKPWIDGLYVMWIVVGNTVTSVAVAWLAVYMYAVGWPFAAAYPYPSPTLSSSSSGSHLSADASSDRFIAKHFLVTVGVYFVAFTSVAYAVTRAYMLSNRVMSFNAESTRVSFSKTLLRNLARSWPVLLVVTAAGGALMHLLRLRQVQFDEFGNFQLVVLLLGPIVFIRYSEHESQRRRRRRRSELSEPPSQPSARLSFANANALAPPPSAARLRARPLPIATPPTRWEQCIQRYIMPSLSLGAGFVYMHVPRVLQRRLQQQWQVTLFAACSLLLKISIQEATKRFQLRASRNPPARVAHVVLTVPTLLVDAQIRMAFVQMGGSGGSQQQASIVGSSFAIVVSKILFRLAKILRLRRTIKMRLGQSKGIKRVLKRVNSKIAVRDVHAARAEYSQFLDWKNYMLRLHAAEVYADMHGEYISLGIATAVVFFLSAHPLYAMQPSGVLSPSSAIQHQMVGALVQAGTALTFDYLASVVEGVHEVPLHESISDEGHGLRGLMHVLLGALAIVNVGVIAIFALRSDSIARET